MFGEAFSIAAALFLAASTIFAAKALRDIKPLNANVLKSLFASISMLPIAFFLGEFQSLSNIDTYGLFIVVIAAIIGFGFGDTCLFKSITLIGVSRSNVIAYTYPLFTAIFAVLFLDEQFVLEYLIGTIIIFLGVINVLTEKSDRDAERSNKGFLMAFATSILWSIGTTMVALGIKRVDVILANTVRFPFLFAFLFLISRMWREKVELNMRNLGFLAATGILSLTLGGIALLFGIQQIGVSRAVPLFSSSPVWASLMAGLFLKEKITWRIIASSLMVVLGIYFLT